MTRLSVLLVAVSFLYLAAGHSEAQTPVNINFAAPSYPLPSNVQSALINAPSTFGESISGTKEYSSTIIKTKVMSLSKGSTLQFDLDPRSPQPDFIGILAETVYIEGAQKPSDLINITYKYTNNIDGGVGATGLAGTAGGANGLDGSNGSKGLNGQPGAPNLALPPVYILFQNVNVSNGNPQSSGLMSLDFDGSRGGNGGPGGRGGRGGDGLHGSDGSSGGFPFPTCTAGPGRGGNSGIPGPGGVGGDGTPAGSGSDIHLFGPSNAVNIMGYFVVHNAKSTSVGKGGPGGFCGEYGNPGGPGSKPSLCPSGAAPGVTYPCNPPVQNVSGNTPTQSAIGRDGTYSITVRDLSDLLQ